MESKLTVDCDLVDSALDLRRAVGSNTAQINKIFKPFVNILDSSYSICPGLS